MLFGPAMNNMIIIIICTKRTMMCEFSLLEYENEKSRVRRRNEIQVDPLPPTHTHEPIIASLFVINSSQMMIWQEEIIQYFNGTYK